MALDILGPTFGFPIPSTDGVVSAVYGALPDDKIADVMACCNGLAQCEKKVGNNEQVSVEHVLALIHSNPYMEHRHWCGSKKSE